MVDDWRTAARYGMPFGIGLAVFAGIIGLLNLFGPSSQLRALPYFWLLAAVICAFVAGFIAARARGSFVLGVDAGAVACAAPLALIALIFGFGTVYHGQQTDSVGQYLPGFVNAAIVALLLLFGGVACGAVLGGLVGIPGALLGRIQANLDGGASSDGETPSPPEEHSADDSDPALPLTNPSSGDIVINPSWIKGSLFLVLTFLFAALAYGGIRSGQSAALSWFVFCLCGLGVPLILANLVFNHPLLRFSDEGIAYRGSYFGLRGRVAWKDISRIDLRPPTGYGSGIQEWFLGRYEIYIVCDDAIPQTIRMMNWQLPSRVRLLLRAATIRYSQQIEKNDIVVRGVE
ncbi:MAG TPA: hypothetical protein VFW17_06005 [Ktedonobacterales bacterium]|nr:hypothetical protein [Ktedonobacterales bacterium]